MRVDAALETTRLMEVPDIARRLESLGYDGVFTFEGPHEPFLALMLAAEHTTRIELTTAVAIAFARNPMTTANIAYDIQLASGGRMVLGLGSQIKPHIERRYSMEWSRPAARMREFVLALRAIFDSWQTGAPLDFQGDFYRHTLMTPMFNPGPCPQGPPRIVLAGVGPKMTAIAGEVADGFIVHPFSTPEFMRATTLPAIDSGLALSGRTRESFEIAFPAMTAVGNTDAEIHNEREALRMRVAFYGSTPAYGVVLEHHGWGAEHRELHRLSKQQQWGEMNNVVSDAMLDAFVTSGTPDTIAEALRNRYGALVDRVAVDPPATVSDADWARTLQQIKG